MAVQNDELKALNEIIRVLENSSIFGSNRSSDVARDRQKRASENLDKRNTDATNKSLFDLSTKAQNSAQGLHTLTRATVTSSGGIGKFTAAVGLATVAADGITKKLSGLNITSTFQALESAAEAVKNKIESSAVPTLDVGSLVSGVYNLNSLVIRPLNDNLKGLSNSVNDASAGLNESVVSIGKMAAGMPKGEDIGMMARSMGAINSLLIGRSSSGNTVTGGLGRRVIAVTALMRGLANSMKGLPQVQSSSSSGGGGGGGGGGGDSRILGLGGGGKRSKGEKVKRSILINGAKEIGSSILGNGGRIIDDMFQTLAARGYGASDSLLDMYGMSIKAGMSLQEYAKTMDENMGVVTRLGSFEQFNGMLRKTSSQLAPLGVIGKDATVLGATMAGTSQSLGIPISDLSSSTSNQVKIFETLQKSVAMTSEGFGELVKMVADNEAIQRELAGLAPTERAARHNQILQISSLAGKMGLTGKAAAALTQSMLDARKSTVKERFQAAGRLTQALGLTGADGGTVDRARQLAGKRNKSAQEELEYTRILGNLGQRLEQMKAQGGALAYQAEKMEEALPADVKARIEASTSAKVAGETGKAGVNEDMGKKLDQSNQVLGQMLAQLNAAAQNPAVMMAAQAASTAASVAVTMAAAAVVSAAVHTSSAKIVAAILGKPGGGIGGPDTSDGKKKSKLGKLAGAAGKFAGIGAAAYTGYQIYDGIQEANKLEAAGETAKADEARGEAYGTGLGTALGAGLGVAVSGAIGAMTGGVGLIAGTAITGAIASAGGWLGGKIGNWMMSSQEATDKNRKATEANTKMEKSATDAVKSLNSSLSKGTFNNEALVESQLETQLNTALAAAQANGTYKRATATDALNMMVKGDAGAQIRSQIKDEEIEKIRAQALADAKADPSTKTKGEVFALRDKLVKERTAAVDAKVEERIKSADFTKSQIGMVTAAGAAASQPVIQATPASQPKSASVATPGDVNTETGKKAEESKDKKTSGIKQVEPLDPTQVLVQILETLKESLTVENKQVDIATQMLKDAGKSVSFIDSNALQSYTAGSVFSHGA